MRGLHIAEKLSMVQSLITAVQSIDALGYVKENLAVTETPLKHSSTYQGAHTEIC